ncbi:hypothetical protein D3C86_2015630 [compost metagenome]
MFEAEAVADGVVLVCVETSGLSPELDVQPARSIVAAKPAVMNPFTDFIDKSSP